MAPLSLALCAAFVHAPVATAFAAGLVEVEEVLGEFERELSLAI